MTSGSGKAAARVTQASENLCAVPISVRLGRALTDEPPCVCLFVAASSRAASKEEYQEGEEKGDKDDDDTSNSTCRNMSFFWA